MADKFLDEVKKMRKSLTKSPSAKPRGRFAEGNHGVKGVSFGHHVAHSGQSTAIATYPRPMFGFEIFAVRGKKGWYFEAYKPGAKFPDRFGNTYHGSPQAAFDDARDTLRGK